MHTINIRPIRVGGLLLPSNVLMAPLAGYTCYPFRMLAYELGAGLCFTEMCSANALKYEDRATNRLLITTPAEPVKAVQLLGGNPAVMERMAKSPFLEAFDIIDINMGCPVPNVFKSGEGSALMQDAKRAAAVIRGCKRSGKVVTVKCRVGIRENELFAAEFARVCEDAGADMITIHGRSRSMMYDGKPHMEEYYDETFTLSYMKKLASYMMKKRKGMKRYKEQMYRSGSLDELKRVIALIFGENQADI